MPEEFATEVDVAVIGCGPVGATLACLLGSMGVKTLVLESAPDIYQLPRAVHFDDEVMRIFQAAGIAAQLEPLTRRNPGTRFVDSEGELLLDWPRPQTITQNGWRASYRFHQPDLEVILRDRIRALDNVELRLNCEVTDLTQDGEGVTLTCRDHGTGQIHTITSRFVVGCDGARSFTRRSIGSSMEDLGFREKWLVVDLKLKQEMPVLGDFTIQHCDPDRPMTYVRCPRNWRRWEVSLEGIDDPDAMALEENVWSLLSRWITPDQASLERKAIYEFRSCMARQWRNGRIFLAGDAAHQMPPFMGQGMCAGIRDVSNLAWKLTAGVREIRSEAFFDTYMSERAPNLRQFIGMSVAMGKLLNNSGTAEELRAAFPQAGNDTALKTIAPPLGPGLGDPANERVGRLVSQLRHGDGNLSDELLGGRPVLLVEQLGDHIGVPNNMETITSTDTDEKKRELCTAILAETNSRAVLVRPDHYVFACANSDEEIADALVRWGGI